MVDPKKLVKLSIHSVGHWCLCHFKSSLVAGKNSEAFVTVYNQFLSCIKIVTPLIEGVPGVE